MAKKERIVSYTAEELVAMRARGGDRTNYARRDSDAEIERQIAEDPDLAMPEDWAQTVFAGLPCPLPGSKANDGNGNPPLA